eukprot:TRINITY_DN3749_c0_g4_i2.p1 TRINITY_DN3749_c0_g4~~TRINITY_DN3749_c0_g4_i2.p1  ORF type:complete len:440 (+),score=112.49 TRINITY_DN3749_c0_g4_i2:44-1363(+)
MEPANAFTSPFDGKTKPTSKLTMRLKEDNRVAAYFSENNSDVESNTPEMKPRKGGVDTKELSKKLSAFAGQQDDRFAVESGNESNEDKSRTTPAKATSTTKPSKFAKMAPVTTGTELNEEDNEHDSNKPKNIVRATSGALKKPDDSLAVSKAGAGAPPGKFVNKALEAVRRENTSNAAMSDNEASKRQEVKGIGAHPFRHLIFNPSVDENKFKKHLVMVYKGLVYSAKCLKGPSEKFIKAKQVDIRSLASRPKTLCLDLDETMIHTCTMKERPDVVLTAKDDYGNSVSIPVKIRPYLHEFLKRMAEMFDIVVYTAGADYYANAILNHIDPNKVFLSDILSRKNCMETKNGFVIKDLRIIRNRELKDIVIVDNLSHSFGFQIENGIPILEFLDDPNDKELFYLANYLTECSKEYDMREFNKSKLRLFDLIEVNEDELFQV